MPHVFPVPAAPTRSTSEGSDPASIWSKRRPTAPLSSTFSGHLRPDDRHLNERFRGILKRVSFDRRIDAERLSHIGQRVQGGLEHPRVARLSLASRLGFGEGLDTNPLSVVGNVSASSRRNPVLDNRLDRFRVFLRSFPTLDGLFRNPFKLFDLFGLGLRSTLFQTLQRFTIDPGKRRRNRLVRYSKMFGDTGLRPAFSLKTQSLLDLFRSKPLAFCHTSKTSKVFGG